MRRSLLLAALLLLPAMPAASPAAGDPYRSVQWGLGSIEAPAAWAATRGAGAVVAVVDTGVDLDHPDLKANIVTAAGANIWCRIDGPRDCPGDDADDDHGHGTHVAGIIAAVEGNGEGGAGVAPDATILPVKALSEEGGGSLNSVAAAIRFAADNGADVINLSLSDLTGMHLVPGRTRTLESAVSYAWAAGVTIVAAASNDGLPLCGSPAILEKVICVGSVDRDDVKSWFSNFGGGIDIVAPGGIGSLFCGSPGDIFSTYPAGDRGCGAPRGYAYAAGTSMAAPFVSGVAALLSSQGLTNAQIVERLLSTATDLGIPGHDPVYGAGKVNAASAVAGP